MRLIAVDWIAGLRLWDSDTGRWMLENMHDGVSRPLAAFTLEVGIESPTRITDVVFDAEPLAVEVAP